MIEAWRAVPLDPVGDQIPGNIHEPHVLGLPALRLPLGFIEIGEQLLCGVEAFCCPLDLCRLSTGSQSRTR